MLARYPCTVFVETGTGLASSLLHAAAFTEFDYLYSCEIHPDIYSTIKKADLPSRCHVLNASSIDFLQEVLPIVPGRQRCLFWLDAHFPGADFGFASYDACKDDSLRLPLVEELRLIHRLRPNAQDVILADDLRIYEDGPFSGGNLPASAATLRDGERGIAAIEELFRSTHDITRDYRDEGYLLLFPRSSAP
jgi:hypothetical protein